MRTEFWTVITVKVIILDHQLPSYFSLPLTRDFRILHNSHTLMCQMFQAYMNEKLVTSLCIRFIKTLVTYGKATPGVLHTVLVAAP